MQPANVAPRLSEETLIAIEFLNPNAILKKMTYDLIVIGSGPGGYSAAVRAGQYGLKTAIIEKDPKLGGTCLHVGCIPTKALLHTADVWEHFLHSGEEGIHCENPRLDYPKVLDRKNKIVAKHAKGVEFLMKKNKVDWIKGFATLKPRGANGLLQVEVKSDGGTQTLETKNIIIATGSEARMLPGLKPDAKTILTNIEILNLPAIPKTMLIIGAGAVGVEFASIFNRFGTKVTVLEMLPRLVPVEDEEVSKELERYFKKTGIRCETGAKAENITSTDKGVRMCVALANGKREDMEAETLLVAVGRKPNTENIGLENTKVELDRGFIKVDEYQRTGEPGVYAIGDVVAGTPQLAHVATMRRHGRGGAHGRQARQADQPQSHSRLHLHRAGHRQRRAHRSAGARAGLQGEGRQVSVRRQQQGQHPGQSRRLRQGRRRREIRRDPGRPHHRAGGLRADRRSACRPWKPKPRSRR